MSQRPQDLNKVVLLFEGNFPEWRDQISAFFISTGRPTQAYPSISHEDGTTTYHESTLGDILDLVAQISPALMKRIPLGLHARVGKIYAYLENLCLRPFRLMDLAPELRNKIYEELVLKSDYQIVSSATSGCRHDIPALAQTTQQLRREALTAYYSGNIFALEDWEPRGVYSHCGISRWQSQAIGPVSGWYRRRRGSGWHEEGTHDVVLRITFDKASGLSLQFPSSLTTKSKRFLMEQEAQAEAERKRTDGEGEAILLLLLNLCSAKVDYSRPQPGNWLNLWFEDGA
ncbi:hypothetical protein PRZ48_010087 [Zasmidium cellare]|uniref:Uncharacterized protein n=1 Tax=Zasmidium cellare TaxID=395010 RepID=A0ABR0EE53_ZASCE|nr:hypothetical protein PRZ48_010087 [Zasmidium cellare]